MEPRSSITNALKSGGAAIGVVAIVVLLLAGLLAAFLALNVLFFHIPLSTR
jgi:hypothetical protein